MPTPTTPMVEHLFGLLKIPRPKTIAQAERMTARLLLLYIGGPDAFDIVYRHRIKEVSTRQIAADCHCRRNKVRAAIQKWDGAMLALQAAINGAEG
jgi:hypothetical protein